MNEIRNTKYIGGKCKEERFAHQVGRTEVEVLITKQ
jgi:hypothetical protein